MKKFSRKEARVVQSLMHKELRRRHWLERLSLYRTENIKFQERATADTTLIEKTILRLTACLQLT